MSLLLLYGFSIVCNVHSRVYCAGTCVSLCICVQRPEVSIESFSIAIHLIYWGRVLHLNPELIDLASLANKCALRVSCHWFLKIGTQADHHTHRTYESSADLRPGSHNYTTNTLSVINTITRSNLGRKGLVWLTILCQHPSLGETRAGTQEKEAGTMDKSFSWVCSLCLVLFACSYSPPV